MWGRVNIAGHAGSILFIFCFRLKIVTSKIPNFLLPLGAAWTVDPGPRIRIK